MSDNIIQLNEDLIKHDLKDLVRNSVEETHNALLDIAVWRISRKPYRVLRYHREPSATSTKKLMNISKTGGPAHCPEHIHMFMWTAYT